MLEGELVLTNSMCVSVPTSFLAHQPMSVSVLSLSVSVSVSLSLSLSPDTSQKVYRGMRHLVKCVTHGGQGLFLKLPVLRISE